MSLNIGIEGTDSEAAAAAAAGIPAAAWGSGALTLSSAQRGAGMYICSLFHIMYVWKFILLHIMGSGALSICSYRY
jgi:hypothetical protein